MEVGVERGNAGFFLCGVSSSRFFFATRESLLNSAVLADIQNRFWTPALTLPQNSWWRESERPAIRPAAAARDGARPVVITLINTEVDHGGLY
jgi:hypothetical protein